jgi:hypothetical protein
MVQSSGNPNGARRLLRHGCLSRGREQSILFAMSVEEIEAAISELSRDELAQLAGWFAEFQGAAWDQQLQADVKAGKLDRLARQAKEDFSSGKCTPL